MALTLMKSVLEAKAAFPIARPISEVGPNSDIGTQRQGRLYAISNSPIARG